MKIAPSLLTEAGETVYDVVTPVDPSHEVAEAPDQASLFALHALRKFQANMGASEPQTPRTDLYI
jgi:hypothetical protein